jgi:hypothetical protein
MLIHFCRVTKTLLTDGYQFISVRLIRKFDRNYYYVAGYPEEGRNWFLNLRYRF